MSTELLIGDVSDTSFWVAYYRAKESAKPDALFHDTLASRLVGTRGQKISESMPEISRYTEWSVVARTVIIDRFVEKLIAEGVDVVINLGAGLDTRPYRLKLPPTLQWIEVDYPKIIAYKTEALKTEIPTCKLTRVEVDLANSSQRKAFLSTVAPDAKKILVLTEGVIPYLSPAQVAELSADLVAEDRIQYWITEYFHPSVYPYLQKAVRTSKMKNAPFLFYPEDWFGFFKKQGWVEKETRFTGEIATEFKRKPPMPKWAEWIMPLLPKKVRQQSLRMSGYVIFRKYSSSLSKEPAKP
jgi:methyltransferase (TIGR00027 family)